MKKGGGLALLVFVLIFFTIAGEEPVHAQSLFETPVDLVLNATPQYPGPNTSVRLSAQSLLLDLSTSNITWYANGTIVAQGIGASEVTVPTGPLGSETRVRVTVRGENASASTEGVLRPTEIDLLWEGESYVPPFYQGRALPSAGGDVRLFAVPRFKRAGSTSFVSPDELIYTWRKNGKVVQSESGLGRHTTRLDAPVLFGADTISVEARTADNTLRGFASVRISSVEPVLTLYENHPVFGILYHRALGVEAIIPETEVAFSVVPYFAPVQNPDDKSLRYAWRVNGAAVGNSPTQPSTITINAEGSSGAALIELALTHATNFFLSARDRWGVTLSDTESASDPFRSPGL